MAYGLTYSHYDFMDRVIPSSASPDARFGKAVIRGIKRLLIAENANPWLTIYASVSAGIWIHYQRERRWLINPGHKYLRVENAIRYGSKLPDIAVRLSEGVATGTVRETQKSEFRQWQVDEGGLELIWSFIEELEKPSQADEFSVSQVQNHPRYFPADAREQALEDFEEAGRWCPGVNRKRHKVEDGDALVFDHILPYAKKGASTYQNIQVLCAACNQSKGATAL